MAKSEKELLWTQRFAEWERSGESRRTWCTANGVTVSTFDYWRRRLRTRALKARRQTLVPMVVKAAPGMATSLATVEIALSRGIAVRTPATVEAGWLAALIRGIEAC